MNAHLRVHCTGSVPNRMMLKMCGETEEKLAQELMDFEFQIERDVVEPLYALAEVPGRRRLIGRMLTAFY